MTALDPARTALTLHDILGGDVLQAEVLLADGIDSPAGSR